MAIDHTNFSIEPFHRAPIATGEYKSKGIERTRHLRASLSQVEMSGHVLEFGVYRGKTMQHISRHFAGQPVWGFDSFVGLPEPWFTRSSQQGPSHPTGKFDMRLEDRQPSFPDNVRLVAGWYHESLPLWLEQHAGVVSFLHIDCDLYSSTRTVLDLLNDRIVKNTTIVFDEFYPWSNYDEYDLWEQGEYRALREWITCNHRRFEVIMRSRHQQCSIRVLQ